MRIDPLLIKEVAGKYDSVSKGNAVAKQDNKRSDEVCLSPNAKFFIKAVKAAKVSDEVSIEKVSRLKEQIENKTYEFNDEKAASKLLNME